MLSHVQFFQIKKLLQGNLIEVECPCGIRFYTFSNKAIYHNNACRQKYFRAKQFELVQEAEIIENVEVMENKEYKPTEIIPPQGNNNETLNRLIEKGKQYSRKLKTLSK